jgi:hypothetical protein
MTYDQRLMVKQYLGEVRALSAAGTPVQSAPLAMAEVAGSRSGWTPDWTCLI